MAPEDQRAKGNPLSPFTTGGGLIFTSGQVGIDRQTSQAAESFEGQVRIAMENLAYALGRAGSSLRQVLKTTVYLVRRDDFAAMNELYSEYFAQEFPARSTIICDLVRPHLLFEIDAIAWADHGAGEKLPSKAESLLRSSQSRYGESAD